MSDPKLSNLGYARKIMQREENVCFHLLQLIVTDAVVQYNHISNYCIKNKHCSGIGKY